MTIIFLDILAYYQATDYFSNFFPQSPYFLQIFSPTTNLQIVSVISTIFDREWNSRSLISLNWGGVFFEPSWKFCLICLLIDPWHFYTLLHFHTHFYTPSIHPLHFYYILLHFFILSLHLYAFLLHFFVNLFYNFYAFLLYLF